MPFIARYPVSEKGAIAKKLSSGESGGIVVGVMFAALLACCLMVFCYRKRQKQLKKRGLLTG